ncbi:hypothetical protein [Erwinia sorbitola]|uniref:Uncharacterized protein n=1 Tax=Erwinia sorbitola TaxID=2681984 RepID=A0A6I6EGP6_9GAMM|nr:hypothetical protein [Erwinia sorbitola]QGU87075.1 hypothetical protein GN242_07545 [Erwinia sorbitola]
MKNYDKAVALINQTELPDDAEEQLDELAEKSEDLEKAMIEGLGEALFERRNS